MKDLIYITNFRQACAYISDGIQPIRIEYQMDKGVMVFIFKAKDTKKVWKKWMEGEYKKLFKF